MYGEIIGVTSVAASLEREGERIYRDARGPLDGGGW